MTAKPEEKYPTDSVGILRKTAEHKRTMARQHTTEIERYEKALAKERDLLATAQAEAAQHDLDADLIEQAKATKQ